MIITQKVVVGVVIQIHSLVKVEVVGVEALVIHGTVVVEWEVEELVQEAKHGQMVVGMEEVIRGKMMVSLLFICLFRL